MKYQAILFDLDNTLLDFDHSEKIALFEIHKMYFSDLLYPTFETTYFGINKTLWNEVDAGKRKTVDVKTERFTRLCKHYKVKHSIETMADHYEHHLGHNADWFYDVEVTIEQLRKKYKIGIVTNGLIKAQTLKYHNAGFHEWCDCFIISEAEGVAKPHSDIFHIALNKLNCKPEHTLMVGDSLVSDYQGAINVGMDFCWVSHGKALPAEVRQPQYIVKSVNELRVPV